jgi:hypothetical protein
MHNHCSLFKVRKLSLGPRLCNESVTQNQKASGRICQAVVNALGQTVANAQNEFVVPNLVAVVTQGDCQWSYKFIVFGCVTDEEIKIHGSLLPVIVSISACWLESHMSAAAQAESRS